MRKVIITGLKIIGVLMLALVCLVGWVGFKWQVISKTQDYATLAELDAIFADLVSDENVPGMAVAIVAHDSVVWSRGYGFANVLSQKPVTPDTPFLVASVSKVFTGVGVMKAWEEGHILLDDDINDYLSFSIDNPYLSDEVITMRHLATHTAGLMDNIPAYTAAYTVGDSKTSLNEYLKDNLHPLGRSYNAKATFSAHAPGHSWEYSNIGVAVAGELVEAATGTSLDEYTEQYIFAPLGMHNSGWYLSDFEDLDDIAVPYNVGIWPWVYGEEVFKGIPYNKEKSLLGRHDFKQYGFPNYPDGSLRTTVNDVARFLAAMMNGGELNGVRILEEETLMTMFEPQFSDLEKDDFEVDEQALFWVHRDGLIGHAGGDLGANSLIFFDPEIRVGGAVFLNRGSDLISLAVKERVMHQIMDNRDQIQRLMSEM